MSEGSAWSPGVGRDEDSGDEDGGLRGGGQEGELGGCWLQAGRAEECMDRFFCCKVVGAGLEERVEALAKTDGGRTWRLRVGRGGRRGFVIWHRVADPIRLVRVDRHVEMR